MVNSPDRCYNRARAQDSSVRWNRGADIVGSHGASTPQVGTTVRARNRGRSGAAGPMGPTGEAPGDHARDSSELAISNRSFGGDDDSDSGRIDTAIRDFIGDRRSGVVVTGDVLEPSPRR